VNSIGLGHDQASFEGRELFEVPGAASDRCARFTVRHASGAAVHDLQLRSRPLAAEGRSGIDRQAVDVGEAVADGEMRAGRAAAAVVRDFGLGNCAESVVAMAVRRPPAFE
jgi:hypothetical protein